MYKEFVEQSSNPILITEADLSKGAKMVYANKAFLDMSGYEISELIGQTPKMFQGKDSNKSIGKTIKDDLILGKSVSFETVNYKKDSTKYHVKVNIFPIKDEKGIINYYGAVQEDISSKIESIDYLQRFIDHQDNIIVLTDGKKLNYANKRLYEFLGYFDLEEFNSHHRCICEKFIEDDRFFSLAKVPKDKNWIDIVKELPHSERIVTMLRYDFNIHAFSVTVNSFDENIYIITLTNISQTVLKQINLHKKTIHDKLTGAFNREYFEQNYSSLIEEYLSKEMYFALAIFDIDHFKSVNDNFGHDVGDSVLIEMVEVVNRYSRDNDYFIRWGGEEFIMALGVKTSRSLDSVLNHIRTSIEKFDFKSVGKITCSIGATLYKDEEDIENTIKRADDALYYSKRTGRNKVTVN